MLKVSLCLLPWDNTLLLAHTPASAHQVEASIPSNQ